jgi:hypothetical protein
VLDAQVEWLRAEALTGGYELAADRQAEVRATYDDVAALVGARRDEIATPSWTGSQSRSRRWPPGTCPDPVRPTPQPEPGPDMLLG